MSANESSRRVRRVAFIYPQFGPITRKLWSGTPAGLTEGLNELGIEVVPFGFSLPTALRKGVAALDRISGRTADRADHSPLRMRSREIAYAQRLRSAGHIDAGIAVGTDAFRLDRVAWGFPVASYDDTTFAAMWRHPDSDLRIQGFAERDVLAWTDTQARSLRAADVVCMSTSWAARSAVEDYDIPPGRVAVVGMGHHPRAERRNDQRDWTRPSFLFLGVEWQRKNGDRVLEAFRQLRERVPGATLHLVGEHPSVDQPGVVGHGYLPRSSAPAQEELDAVFREATALVLPSLFDPSPISYLEAASAGIPVVATTEGGAGSLLGSAAITVRPRDTGAIRDAMLRLCEPREAERRGQESLRIAATASWRCVAERVIDAIESIGGAEGSAPYSAAGRPNRVTRAAG